MVHSKLLLLIYNIVLFERDVLNATINEQEELEKEKYLWNLIDPLVRLALLNQTQVQKFWKATESLSENKNKLDASCDFLKYSTTCSNSTFDTL